MLYIKILHTLIFQIQGNITSVTQNVLFTFMNHGNHLIIMYNTEWYTTPYT